MLVVVIDEPVDRRVDGHIDLRIVQRGDPRQHHRGAVGLHRRPGVELVHILQENPHRDLFVRIVAGEVDAHQRDELDLRVGFQHARNLVFRRFCGNHIQQVVHFDCHLSELFGCSSAKQKNHTDIVRCPRRSVWLHCRAKLITQLV